MRELLRQFPEAGTKAVGAAGQQLLNDAVMEVPTVPIDTGRLRESGSVLVAGLTPFTSNQGKGTPNVDNPAPPPARKFVAYVGYNTPYACVVHERPMKFTDPSAGNKYLEAKMRAHAGEYAHVAAVRMRRELGM